MKIYVETMTIKGDTLIINEKSFVKMQLDWQAPPGRPQHSPK